MSRLKDVFDWRFWIWQPILAFLLPFLIDQIHFLGTNFKIIGLLFIINSAFSVFVGLYLRSHGSFWYLLIVWPLIFALATWLGFNESLYGYFFAILYFVIGIFSYTHGQTEEIDYNDQIPVDGGFKGDR